MTIEVSVLSADDNDELKISSSVPTNTPDIKEILGLNGPVPTQHVVIHKDGMVIDMMIPLVHNKEGSGGDYGLQTHDSSAARHFQARRHR